MRRRGTAGWAVGAVVLLAMPACALLPAGTANAATLTVTKLGDSLDGTCDADCSLREAIQQANLDATEDVVVLPPGTLRLEIADAAAPEDGNLSGDLDVGRDLVVRGAGAGVTTIASRLPLGKPDRVLDVLGTGTDLRLGDLAIAGGYGLHYGGGIRSAGDGELLLERVIVRDSTAYGEAALGFGGGIYKSTGRLVVRDAAVYGNRGIAPGYGGGIFLNALGTTASLTNVTIAGNTARTGAGVYSNNAIEAELAHVTVTGNEATTAVGGIGGDASRLRLRSSVLAGNAAPMAPNCFADGYAPASDGGNAGDPACGLTQAGDAPSLDVRLGPLGGAPIPVQEPAADSPAVDRAVGPCPASDARGVARPQGRACDAGAAERPVATGPPAPGGPLPVADATPPALSGVGLTRRRFRVGRASTAVVARQRRRAPAGTVVRYTVSEAATVTLAIERALPGRRVGRSCHPATRRLRPRARCTRYVRRAPTLRRRAALGINRIAFSGRIGRRALRAGRYRGVLVATDAAGNASARRIVGFRIVRR